MRPRRELSTPVSYTHLDVYKRQVRKDAVQIFKALDGFGCARVDFFMEKDTNEVVFNEINTMPGFTSISMYPMLWNEKGLDNGALVDKMIQLAFERYVR